MKPQEIIRTSVAKDKNLLSNINIRFVESGTDGLIAWASCIVCGTIKLDNIAIRRSRDGNMFLTYPAKLTPGGKKHHYFNPISSEAADVVRYALLRQVAILVDSAATESDEDTEVQ